MSNKDFTSSFPHDSNARSSEKILNLRMRHRAAGYGVYFMILERLRSEPDFTSAKDYNAIAFDLREDAALIKSVVEDFGLFAFTADGKRFYSESFLRRMEATAARKQSNAQKASIAARARWSKAADKEPAKEPAPKPAKPPVPAPAYDTPPADRRSLEEKVAEMKADGFWLDQLQVSFSMDVDALRQYIDMFIPHVHAYAHADRIASEPVAELKRFFCNWLRKAAPKPKAPASPPPTDADYDFNGGFGSLDT